MDIKNWFKNMGRKKKEVVPEVVPNPEARKYEWSDLVIQCKCGNMQTLNKGMSDGLQLLLFPTDKSFIKLMCDKCDSELTLRLIEGVKPDDVDETVISEEKQDEGIQKEDKQEEVL
jgi:hypothetical protein